jgi:hypothetical protein
LIPNEDIVLSDLTICIRARTKWTTSVDSWVTFHIRTTFLSVNICQEQSCRNGVCLRETENCIQYTACGFVLLYSRVAQHATHTVHALTTLSCNPGTLDRKVHTKWTLKTSRVTWPLTQPSLFIVLWDVLWALWVPENYEQFSFEFMDNIIFYSWCNVLLFNLVKLILLDNKVYSCQKPYFLTITFIK